MNLALQHRGGHSDWEISLFSVRKEEWAMAAAAAACTACAAGFRSDSGPTPSSHWWIGCLFSSGMAATPHKTKETFTASHQFACRNLNGATELLASQTNESSPLCSLSYLIMQCFQLIEDWIKGIRKGQLIDRVCFVLWWHNTSILDAIFLYNAVTVCLI